MYVLVVCSLWACASLPLLEFSTIKPCITAAPIYAKGLPPDSPFSVVCMTKEQYNATQKIQRSR